VTPVYWSASQLLSKLDNHTQEGSYSPYVTTVTDDYSSNYQQHVVDPGPRSLQLQPHSEGLLRLQPSEGLHLQPSEGLLRYSTSEYYQQIPEEYTITVVSGEEELTRKVPPPVMPKPPRNITQV
jgi:hypothetical protein